ncbi:MAG: hypothetical protein L3J59_08730 [Methylococcaceae bacterium]|nr:hypothetical protein [Methylococcaceae bacterium]
MLKRLKIDQSPQTTSSAVIEVIVLTLSSLVLGYFITSEAGFFSILSFSSLLMGPLLCGLRYGFLYALNSTLLLIGSMWAVSQYSSIWASNVFSGSTLGLIIIPLIAGEFRNHWEHKMNKSQGMLSYIDQRLGEVTNAFNILKISHEKLAQRTASQTTLRNNIIAVRNQIMKNKMNDSDAVSLNDLILKLFAEYCSIQQAGLYAVDDSGNIINTALTFYGGSFQIISNDLVLKEALNTLKTTSLKPELATKEKYNKYILLAIPLIDVSGRNWGIVVVNKMPYRAFLPDNIRLFAILGGYIADLIGKRSDSYYCEDVNLQSFLLHLKRCLHNLKAFDIPSTLVIIKITNEHHAIGMNNLIIARQRGLDRAWSTKNIDGKHIVFILLPLSTIAGTEGYKLRLEQIVNEQYNYVSLEDANIEFHRKYFVKNQDLQEMMPGFFQKFNIDKKYWQKQ